MVGHNEADRYLVDVLTNLIPQVDKLVFLDDCSIDDTPNIAEAMGAEVMQTDHNLFTENESELRQQSWEFVSKYAQPGDWILCVDCDERFYGGRELDYLLDQSRYDILGITHYQMWTPTHYRVDKAWKPHISTRLFRYFEGGEVPKRKLACGSEPSYVQTLMRRRRMLARTPLRIQHLGYIRDEDKISKHQRYMELDGGLFHSRSHLESILDPNPTLVKWEA